MGFGVQGENWRIWNMIFGGVWQGENMPFTFKGKQKHQSIQFQDTTNSSAGWCSTPILLLI